jgi:hypothetical protein
MLDSNYTPHKVIVEQAMNLPITWTEAFMTEQPERFVPYMDSKSKLISEEYVCPDCFLNEQFGTSNPEDLCAMFFDDMMRVHHVVNVINFLTEYKAVAFGDEGLNGGYAVVVNYPYRAKSGGVDELTQAVVDSASETIIMKVATQKGALIGAGVGLLIHFSSALASLGETYKWLQERKGNTQSEPSAE